MGARDSWKETVQTVQKVNEELQCMRPLPFSGFVHSGPGTRLRATTILPTDEPLAMGQTVPSSCVNVQWVREVSSE